MEHPRPRGDHRTTIAAIITAGLLPIATATATACAGDEITSTLSKTGAAEAPAEKADAEPEPAAATVAKTGETITLKGTEDDLKVDAVLQRWDDNTDPQTSTPGPPLASASSPPRSSSPTQE
ncbi:hypothetical protein AB0C45_01700 [Streptomyces cyaneofuscatus]|uniref:hypothetical protein n=1 Tax=Streptomyces cyaneofuscatus TaxID=66883 RepID=UPI0033FF9317